MSEAPFAEAAISEPSSVKRRRLILKQERATSQGAMEALKGVSYESGVGHSTEVDIEKLPEAIARGNFKPVKVGSGEPTFIAIDLETTDLTDELFCMYNEIRVDNGTTYVSGAPACDSCTCYGTVLDCCKYGYQAGTAHIEGCFHQTIVGSCDFNFVQANGDLCEFK